MLSDLDVFKSENEALRNEKTRLDDLVSRVQADKQRLGERIAKLTASERELILELERVKSVKGVGAGGKGTGGGGGRGGARASSPSKAVERLRRELETDRDYWRGECDLLQQMLLDLKSRAVSFSGTGASSAGARIASPAAAGKGLKGARPTATTTGRARSPSPARKTGASVSAGARARSTSRDRPPSRSLKKADDKGVDIVDSGHDSISIGSERFMQTDKKVRALLVNPGLF